MGSDTRKGKCEGCGNAPRVLTRIESGQSVCRSCLQEIRGPAPAPKRAEKPRVLPPRVNHRSVNVAGVTHDNRDGTSRQNIIASCSPGEILRLVHETDNPVSSKAVAVVRLNGEQLGYLPSDDAAEVFKGSERGWLYCGVIREIFRFEYGNGLGVAMALVYAQADTDKALVRDHVAALVDKFKAAR